MLTTAALRLSLALDRRKIYTLAAAGLTLILSLSSSRHSQAQTATDEADKWFRFLGEINRYSAVEPAGSRGSIGVGAGVGAVTGRRQPSPLIDAQLNQSAAEEEDDTYYLPKFWLVKGLPWPVDLGIAGGAAPDGRFTQAGAHVQWTAFEELGLPALTLRASYDRLFGIPGTEFSSQGIEAVGSWGFLQIFTVYATLGAAQHQGQLVAEQGQPAGLLLAEGDASANFEASWIEPVQVSGLRVMAIPPFVSVTAETTWRGGEARNYAAKLSVGM